MQLRFVALFLLLAALPALAATPLSEREISPGLKVPDAAKPGPGFDVERATDAYLNLLSPEQRAKSDAYFEGQYWLRLWGLLYTLGTAMLLLATGWSRRMRGLAQRVSGKPWAYTMIYVVLFSLAMFVLDLPWSIYTNFVREHQYDLATQTFGAWFGDQLKGLGVTVVFLPPFVTLIYAAVRKTRERWWIWASGIAFAGIIFFGMIAPVTIAPLFNKYEPLPAGDLREQILSMARANRIPADDVFLFDASRQTTRVSANVSGLFGTTRISLNDNLLERTSPEEIRAVMAHEMGHYVLNHSLRLTIYITLILGVALFVVHKLFDRVLARLGVRWGVEDRGDPAGLPAALALLSIVLTLATPLVNSTIRQAEAEADAFALAASREPHGFATVALRLSTYRKMKPGPLEEIVFHDHPSGYDRIFRSMTWLKENMEAEQP